MPQTTFFFFLTLYIYVHVSAITGSLGSLRRPGVAAIKQTKANYHHHCALQGAAGCEVPQTLPAAKKVEVQPALTMFGGEEWNLTPLRPVLPPNLGHRDGATLNNTCGAAPTRLAGSRQGSVALTSKHGRSAQCCVCAWPVDGGGGGGGGGGGVVWCVHVCTGRALTLGRRRSA